MKRLALLLALAACGSHEPEYGGVGPWSVNETTLRRATGICEPTDLPDGRKGTWCFAQTPLKIAGSTTEVDLYFDGVLPDSKLIELQLKVRGCHEDQLETWMRQTYGIPFENRSRQAFWKNRYLYAAAFMPSKPGECLVRMLPLSEEKEWQRIHAPPADATVAPAVP